ncbi:cbb3-type cytochrome c oxidase subunit I [Pantoea ananatis]|uniref:cbb3-type cytochrome c oxidase subunit I n=1 Tax=Pantoea ananas TaxID=553 RepID=UPI00221F7643|nr:cbb3-type cytochrome c oxidase subunit I [Pantoea ananatis]
MKQVRGGMALAAAIPLAWAQSADPKPWQRCSARSADRDGVAGHRQTVTGYQWMWRYVPGRERLVPSRLARSLILPVYFMFATMLISIPTGVKVFNWVSTMWQGSMTFESPMLWAIAFVILFTIGGFSGLMLAIVPADFQYHDTYFPARCSR